MKVVLVLTSLLATITAGAAGGALFERSRTAELYPRVIGDPGAVRAGPERVLVLLASSDCSASRMPSLGPDLASIRQAMVERFSNTDTVFRTLGVSVDAQPQRGIAFLRTFEPFDEIAVGRSWMNSAALHFVWRGVPGPSAVPQVVLVDREVRSASGAAIDVTEDVVVGRAVGLSAIHELAERIRREGIPQANRK